jgi:histidinol-phosphate aminotransferase
MSGHCVKVSEEILNMTPYKPGKPISETQREYGIKDVIKLASNENPLGISEKVKKAIIGAIANAHIYPDASCFELVQKLSKIWSVPRERIAVGNGSDELIDLLVRIYCEPGESILTSEAAFVAYSVRAGASRVKVQRTPLASGFRFDLKGMAKYLRENREKQKIRLVFIANPNNPTGTYNTRAEVDEFLKEFGNHDEVLIVFDEAYTEFVRAKDYYSAQNYLTTFKNVVVLKTLSKIYGLAGLRIGVMLAPPETVDLVNRVRTPFNVNEFAQAAALAALDDFEFIQKTCEATWHGLDYFYQELRKMGLPYIESQGNFVMFDTLRDIGEVNESLLRRGVIMRPIQNYGFKTEMRLSVGLPQDNKRAIEALREVIKDIKPIK